MLGYKMKLIFVALLVGLCATESEASEVAKKIFKSASNFLKNWSHNLGICSKEEKEGSSPWFCHGLKCPNYTVVEKGEGFEERCYESTKWVATEVQGIGRDDSRKAFRRLFNYIQGENDKKMKIKMTAPVVTRMNMDGEKIADNFMRMHFFIPPSEETVPKPTNEDVQIVQLPKVCMYVHSFGWYMNPSKQMEEMNKLKNALRREGKESDYHNTVALFAGYDSPFRLFWRHNEVWLEKKP